MRRWQDDDGDWWVEFRQRTVGGVRCDPRNASAEARRDELDVELVIGVYQFFDYDMARMGGTRSPEVA